MPEEWLGVVTGVGAVKQFEDLRLPCSLVTADQRNWLKIWGSDANVAAHELLQGAEAARSEYNHRALTHVARTKRPWQATHNGFSDLFVPILQSGRVTGFLVCGSFTGAPWSASDIREQWQKLTQRPLRPNDPELLSYAEAVLTAPLLPKRAARALVAILLELAKLLGDSKVVHAGRDRWHRLTQRHLHRRLHFNMWQMAAGLVDPIEQAAWSAANRSWQRRYLGLTRLPTLVLALSRSEKGGRDALEALVENHRFVVDCADVALEIEDAAAGRAGGSVAYLLLYCNPTLSERAGRKAARQLAQSIRSRLRDRGHVRLHIGVSSPSPAPRGLALALREALRGLEWALHKNQELVFYADQQKEMALGPARPSSLSDLMRAIHDGAAQEARVALEAVVSEIVWQSAANAIAARAYADAFYSQALRTLGDLDLLESSVLSDALSQFRESLEQVSSVTAIAARFRIHVLHLVDARTRPRSVRRDSKLARALRHLETHAAEPLKLAEVAKLAGYAPQHFSRLLRRQSGQGFQEFVLSLRIARAKELLHSSELAIADVAETIGIHSLSYFHRVFQRELGVTPAAFRVSARGGG
jgi:AraC-like DNA-binding protein